MRSLQLYMYVAEAVLPHRGARHLLGGVEFQRLHDNFVLVSGVAIKSLLEVIHDELKRVRDALFCLLSGV